jgi:hypothetical protein
VNSSLENVEIEYIKNLQQQVYFLDLECNYLRQQLNTNGLTSSSKYDKKSQEIKREQLLLEKSLKDENDQKKTLMNLLEQTEVNFHKERELLMNQIETLTREKNEIEDQYLNKSVELNRTKDSLDKHHQDGHMSAFQVEKLQNQVENFRKDNLLLRAEITDARNQLIKRDNTIKELHLELNDPIRNKNGMNSMSMRLSMTNDALTKESLTSQKVFLQ